jgi:hypothetical protein
VTHGDEPAGGRFKVEVIFGERNSDERVPPSPLDPVGGSPGEFQAPLIPTRPGTYSFHLTGTLDDGDQIDEVFTSGEGTFHDVEDPAALQFPVEDPTAGELAERLERVDERLGSLQRLIRQSGPEEAGSGSLALWVAIGAGVLALIALAVGARRRPG